MSWFRAASSSALAMANPPPRRAGLALHLGALGLEYALAVSSADSSAGLDLVEPVE